MRKFNNIVKKPWGYEYLAYENENVALWCLYIAPDQSTSMHCHPNKTTGLILIDGKVEVSFLNDSFELKSLEKIMIRKGLFHSTKATSKEGAYIFEIETPVDKHDLVRLKDKYGREGTPYEDKTFEMPKKNDCLWIEDPVDAHTYKIANSKIDVVKIESISSLKNIQDDKNIIFLRGGLKTNYGTTVAGPGDVISSNALKQLMQVFTVLDIETIIITMEKSNEQ